MLTQSPQIHGHSYRFLQSQLERSSRLLRVGLGLYTVSLSGNQWEVFDTQKSEMGFSDHDFASWPQEIVKRWSMNGSESFEQNLQFALETMTVMLRHEAFQNSYGVFPANDDPILLKQTERIAPTSETC